VASTFEDLLRAAVPSHLTLTAPLKAGGQGAVFRGTCNGQEAAIKAFTTSTDARRIDRECRLLSTTTALNLPGGSAQVVCRLPLATFGTPAIRRGGWNGISCL
jgi:hypothetical protein